MLRTPRVLERIFVHEVFHFVWSKLNHATRRSWDSLIRAEMENGVRGEFAWSAELAKQRVTPDSMANHTRRWKDYLCESFCDTAAYCFGNTLPHSEMTLDSFTRRSRRAWVSAHLTERSLPI